MLPPITLYLISMLNFISVLCFENQVAVYGSDFDSALHLAIKHGPPEAALALIENGANVDFPNAKVCSFKFQ